MGGLDDRIQFEHFGIRDIKNSAEAEFFISISQEVLVYYMDNSVLILRVSVPARCQVELYYFTRSFGSRRVFKPTAAGIRHLIITTFNASFTPRQETIA